MNDKLFQIALESYHRAHSPYSHFKVGAGILTSEGLFFGGCNVENASYGATVCAERVALWSAKTKIKTLRVQELLVLTDQVHPWPPCGLCLQVLTEFSSPQLIIHLTNPSRSSHKIFTLEQLLPQSFNSTHLT